VVGILTRCPKCGGKLVLMKSMYYEGYVYGYCKYCEIWFNAITGKIVKENKSVKPRKIVSIERISSLITEYVRVK